MTTDRLSDPTPQSTSPQKEAFFNIPNLFTLARVILIIPVYVLLSKGLFLEGFTLLIFSILTDFFDGQLARKMNQETSIGALLDPICDKAVILAYFGILYSHTDINPIWLIGLTYARNISQLMAIPILSWWLKVPFKVKPKMLPKYGSAMSFILILAGVYLTFAGNTLLSPLNPVITSIYTWALVPVSAYLELHILVTYLPRLIQIATGKHDTFE